MWGRGFRPFFLAAGGYGGGLTLTWIAIWRGAWPAPAWLAPSLWHAHEMLFGLVAAAIAGFLLTSVPVWTGRRALIGRPLMALAALWAAGRLAMLAAGALPVGLVAALDLAFLPVLALVLARSLWRTGQRRNYGILAVVGVLALANAAVHAQALGWAPSSASRALRFAVDAVVILIVVIGGRITPAFTANALRLRGVEAAVRSRPWLDRLAVASVVGVAGADLFVPAAPRAPLSRVWRGCWSPPAWRAGRPRGSGATRCSPRCTPAWRGSRSAWWSSARAGWAGRWPGRPVCTRSPPARWAR